jgi:formylglycine-generating enzyme required for sulfatase activity
MIWITWRDAALYCNWLTKQVGMNDSDVCYAGGATELAGGGGNPTDVVRCFVERKGFRLPMEAEREIACRAGTSSVFSFGNDSSILKYYGWFLENSALKTHEPGELRPNPWGLFDMHGNTYNWCTDWYGPYSRKSEIDPIGPESGDGHVLRGGGWNYGPRDARSAHRYFSQEHNRNAKIGFRLVQTLS